MTHPNANLNRLSDAAYRRATGYPREVRFPDPEETPDTRTMSEHDRWMWRVVCVTADFTGVPTHEIMSGDGRDKVDRSPRVAQQVAAVVMKDGGYSGHEIAKFFKRRPQTINQRIKNCTARQLVRDLKEVLTHISGAD